jgi:nitroimidazol reductase NimA-like FMN-containing flavoprotein (pyridoxamine 5'-phosphate oxidase superfamily)
MASFEKDDRNRVRRLPERGAYDAATIYAIVDEAKICHAGFVHDGQPFVIPTIHAREGDTIYLHGSKASRLLEHARQGEALCITVTLLDGIVVARSAFHSSMNYRSAVLFGRGCVVEDPAAKLHALEVLTEHVLPGRWAEVRPTTEREVKATSVVAVAIESASAKTRSGPPNDDEEDYALPIWAGVLPIRAEFLSPLADPKLGEHVPLPSSVRNALHSGRNGNGRQAG